MKSFRQFLEDYDKYWDTESHDTDDAKRIMNKWHPSTKNKDEIRRLKANIRRWTNEYYTKTLHPNKRRELTYKIKDAEKRLKSIS